MSKITESAGGEQCQVRIPGVCNRDPETVVFAHMNGGGLAMKQPDCEGAYCCSACHDVYDRRVKPRHLLSDDPSTWAAAWQQIDIDFYQGCVRTRRTLIEKGLIILK